MILTCCAGGVCLVQLQAMLAPWVHGCVKKCLGKFKIFEEFSLKVPDEGEEVGNEVEEDSKQNEETENGHNDGEKAGTLPLNHLNKTYDKQKLDQSEFFVSSAEMDEKKKPLSNKMRKKPKTSRQSTGVTDFTESRPGTRNNKNEVDQKDNDGRNSHSKKQEETKQYNNFPPINKRLYT